MVDIAGLPTTALTPADFQFKVGNDDNPSGWTQLPQSVLDAMQISVRPGAGENSSDRVTITWPDRTIANTWLEVTVKATANTGLSTPDVHYWGNTIGDSGNSAANTIVNATDEIGARTTRTPASSTRRRSTTSTATTVTHGSTLPIKFSPETTRRTSSPT